MTYEICSSAQTCTAMQKEVCMWSGSYQTAVQQYWINICMIPGMPLISNVHELKWYDIVHLYLRNLNEALQVEVCNIFLLCEHYPAVQHHASLKRSSRDTGVHWAPFITNTTPLSINNVALPKLYSSLPSYLFCPGTGMKRIPLSSAYRVIMYSKGMVKDNSGYNTMTRLPSSQWHP